MKVQSPLQMNNYELQNAVVQNQGGFAEHDWRKGQLQFDSTQNVDKLAVGIDSGQGAEGSKYRYLLDSRPNGVSNEMLAGFSNTTSDIESALANFFPSCAAVRNFVNALVSSALIYKGTVTPESLKKNTITVDADDYRYAGTAASGTYRHRWYNGNVYRYTATSTPAVGERAYSDTAGSYSFTIADVLSKLYADMFIESGVARSTLPTTKGWLYKSSGSGYFGSVAVETGDSFICNGGTAHTAADYDIVQTNIDLLNIPELGVTASEVARLTLSAGGEGSRKSAIIDANANGLLTISPYTNVEVDGSVLPAEDDSYDLGSTSKKWASLHAGTVYEDGTALASKYYLATNPSGFITSDGSCAYATNSGNASHVSPKSYSAAGNTVGQHKEALAAAVNNQGYGIGDNITVGADVIQNWDYEYTEVTPSSVYSLIKIGGGYASSQYGQWLLSSYGTLRLGIVGRSSNQWSSVKWLAWTEDLNDYLKKAEGGTLTGPLIIDGSDGGNSLNILNGAYLNIYSDEDNNSALFFLYGDSEAIVKLSVDENGVLTLNGESGTSASFDAPSIKENGTPISDKYAPKATTPKMFRADITGNGSTTTFTLTHGLGTQSPIVQIYEQTSREQVLVDVVANTANTVQVKFGAAPLNGKVYNVVIMG